MVHREKGEDDECDCRFVLMKDCAVLMETIEDRAMLLPSSA